MIWPQTAGPSSAKPVVIALDTPDQLPIIAITLDTYSHVLPNMRDADAAAMEEALS